MILLFMSCNPEWDKELAKEVSSRELARKLPLNDCFDIRYFIETPNQMWLSKYSNYAVTLDPGLALSFNSYDEAFNYMNENKISECLGVQVKITEHSFF